MRQGRLTDSHRGAAILTVDLKKIVLRCSGSMQKTPARWRIVNLAAAARGRRDGRRHARICGGVDRIAPPKARQNA
jgi:hypothetical protein